MTCEIIEPIDEWCKTARELGREHARNAASWATDGNESDESRERKLAMLEDGDPAVFDYLPREPNLSGEFADDLTPLSLAREITRDEDPDLDVIEYITNAYEYGVSVTFTVECEAVLRAATS